MCDDGMTNYDDNGMLNNSDHVLYSQHSLAVTVHLELIFHTSVTLVILRILCPACSFSRSAGFMSPDLLWLTEQADGRTCMLHTACMVRCRGAGLMAQSASRLCESH